MVLPALPGFLLLDLDDTILDDSGGAANAWVTACGEAGAPSGLLDAIEAERLWFWADADRHRTGRLDLPAARREIVRGALGRLGLEDEQMAAHVAGRHDALRDDAIVPLAGAIETLERLQAAGVPLALVTNGSAAHQRFKIERFGLAPYFDYIGIEGEVGVGKPFAEAFTRALDALDATPADTWMVGDNLRFDVAGSQAVGIHAVWVDRYVRGLPDGGDVTPDRIVTAISELLGP
jgi:putative hydrolase of the HAD superfamily